jgi:hypothetical protein
MQVIDGFRSIISTIADADKNLAGPVAATFSRYRIASNSVRTTVDLRNMATCWDALEADGLVIALIWTLANEISRVS